MKIEFTEETLIVDGIEVPDERRDIALASIASILVKDIKYKSTDVTGEGVPESEADVWECLSEVAIDSSNKILWSLVDQHGSRR